MNEQVFSSLFCATKFRTALILILTLFSLPPLLVWLFIVVPQADSGLLMFSEPMDCFLWLFINSEQFFAHLFDTSYRYWLCILGIVLEDIACGQGCGFVIVIMLLFANTVLMTNIFSIGSARGCTSDKVFARISISAWIAIVCLAGLLVVIYLFTITVVMPADVVGYQLCEFMMTLLFAVIPGSCTSCQNSGIVIVVLLLFALTAVIAFMFLLHSTRDCTSGKGFGQMFMIMPPIAIGCWACTRVMMVVPLLFALTVVMTYMFSITSLGCTSDKVFARMFVVSRWIALECWAGLLAMIYLFAIDVMLADVTSGQKCRIMIVLFLLFAHTAVIAYMFSITGIRVCTSDEGSIRIFVIGSWIAPGCWEGILIITTNLFAFYRSNLRLIYKRIGL